MKMNEAWINILKKTLESGTSVSPRGMLTLEHLGQTLEVDMNYPVLTVPERKLSYKFMHAEAYWILSGRYDVAYISRYNKQISKFSDDGEVFYGAYGPQIMPQLPYIVKKLVEDPDTRQAVMTIWIRNPSPSKDIPCTVAVAFQIRDGLLHCLDFMRSSDQWLGLPYDAFNFSMLSALVCAEYNHLAKPDKPLGLGTLRLVAASSHLYEQHFAKAQEILDKYKDGFDDSNTPHVPQSWLSNLGHIRLPRTLHMLAEDGFNWSTQL